MSAKEDGESVHLELLRLKEKIGLLEDLCGEDFSEEAVKAAAKDLRQRVDRIANLVPPE